MNQIPDVVTKIKSYRNRLLQHPSASEIDKEFGSPVEGTPARPLYFMHRAGIGFENFSQTRTGILVNDGLCPIGTPIYRLNSNFEAFVDHMIKNPPANLPQDINVNQWFAHYGASVVTVVQDLLDDDDPIWKAFKENFLDKEKKLVLLSGPPGTSKTWYAEKIAYKIAGGESSCVEKVQFHQSYCYEDFVEGYAPASGGSGFTVRKKVFRLLCDKAFENPGKPYVLVIDEFTRGDPSRIFGEILTYMEYPGRPVKLMYSEEEFYMPTNLFIIGTMNPYDKSISDLDIMLERRFERFKMLPDTQLLQKILKEQQMSDELIQKVTDFFVKVQAIYDIGFGHAYFVGVRDEEDLKRLWKFKLYDLFERYFRYEPDKFREIKRIYLWVT